jgi:hypothetical protein
MKYDIEITETLQKTVTVEAEDPEAAMEKVMADYRAGEIVLGGDDMVGDPSFMQMFRHREETRPAPSTERHERER